MYIEKSDHIVIENNVIANIRKVMLEASDKAELFDFNYNTMIGLIPRPNARKIKKKIINF